MTRKVAILGAGMIGEVHRRAAVLAGAQVVGAMASSPERSRQVADAWGAEHAFTSIEEVAASDVDAVHICTPNASHVPYAVALMEAGKHVLCEKPLGVSLEDARQAAEVAERTGVINTMPFAYRFHPMVRELRARVQAEEFGPVFLTHGTYIQDWLLDPRSTSWRVDPSQGGPSRAFGDIGSHWCDLMEWVTGERIAELVSTTRISIPRRPGDTANSFSAATGELDESTLVDVTTEDTAMVLFRTRNGVPGSTVISQLCAGRKNRLWIEVDGAKQSGVFDQEQPEQLWIGEDDRTSLLVRDPNHGSSEQRRLATLPAGHAQGYAQCFEAYVADSYAAIDAQRDGGTPPEGLPTFADGLRAAEICDAMLRSADSHSWQTV
ncbi:putative dehydrogenase [Friedmanniella endophytica]|uniref:Putative dehydrogenase n=1 Tax=Microlunatus kandeliicorticis TaxID=1759536 RepID=A0A7W3IQP1_9ACTN|nr:Gfo/Idh/MocA family oxidoreductase [Microlunatus kandeliicorticis]MBA8793472.1 putative dehydrogenase [Microlunatus kandeliicorticis]